MLPDPIVPDLIARLVAQVAAFGGRVQGAGSLAALTRTGAARQPQTAAWVIASGLVGRPGQAAAGAFVQSVERGVSVVVTLPAYDGSGAGGSDQHEALVSAVVAALAGWAPATSPGVLQLARAHAPSIQGGIITSQIDFSLMDQLRIPA